MIRFKLRKRGRTTLAVLFILGVLGYINSNCEWENSNYFNKTSRLSNVSRRAVHHGHPAEKRHLNVTKDQGHNKLMLDEKPDWERIVHPKVTMSLYRAYTFVQNSSLHPHEVIILGSYTARRNILVSCRLYYAAGSQLDKPRSLKVPGKMEKMPYYATMKQYPGNFFKCRIPQTQFKMPTEVSVLVDRQLYSPTTLQIHQRVVPPIDLPESEKHYKFQFSVCVMPIFDYDNVPHFLEWMEFYKLMGVQQFSFYNLSIGSNLSCILNYLQHYPQDGTIINVDPWMEYPIIRKNILQARHGQGMVDSIYDCILRHKGVSKYLAVVDLDEFLMPREEAGLHNFKELIETLDATNRSAKFGEYRFRNGFYDREQQVDKKLLERCGKNLRGFEYEVCERLLMMRFAKRHPYQSNKSRTKYICRPEAVNVAAVHTIDVLEKGFQLMHVPVDLGFSRHYREGVKYMTLQNETKTMDRVSEHFGRTLARNVARKMKFSENKCNIENSH